MKRDKDLFELLRDELGAEAPKNQLIEFILENIDFGSGGSSAASGSSGPPGPPGPPGATQPYVVSFYFEVLESEEVLWPNTAPTITINNETVVGSITIAHSLDGIPTSLPFDLAAGERWTLEPTAGTAGAKVAYTGNA